MDKRKVKHWWRRNRVRVCQAGAWAAFLVGAAGFYLMVLSAGMVDALEPDLWRIVSCGALGCGMMGAAAGTVGYLKRVVTAWSRKEKRERRMAA